jgi:hypothetical protein
MSAVALWSEEPIVTIKMTGETQPVANIIFDPEEERDYDFDFQHGMDFKVKYECEHVALNSVDFHVIIKKAGWPDHPHAAPAEHLFPNAHTCGFLPGTKDGNCIYEDKIYMFISRKPWQGVHVAPILEKFEVWARYRAWVYSAWSDWEVKEYVAKFRAPTPVEIGLYYSELAKSFGVIAKRFGEPI